MIIINTTTGLSPKQIKYYCLQAYDKYFNTTRRFHDDYVEAVTEIIIGVAITLLVIIFVVFTAVLSLSYYYKNSVLRNKQAPFNVPSWLPERLFPRYNLYNEIEVCTRYKLTNDNGC